MVAVGVGAGGRGGGDFASDPALKEPNRDFRKSWMPPRVLAVYNRSPILFRI